jgi:hypothetical protein
LQLNGHHPGFLSGEVRFWFLVQMLATLRPFLDFLNLQADEELFSSIYHDRQLPVVYLLAFHGLQLKQYYETT